LFVLFRVNSWIVYVIEKSDHEFTRNNRKQNLNQTAVRNLVPFISINS
jgi:hypothetical protein